MLHKPGKAPQSESYMLLYQTGGDTGKSIVLYAYQSGRGAKRRKEFLAGYKKGYLAMSGIIISRWEITVVRCWVHLRRKYDEAIKSLPKGKAKGSSASQELAYCNLLFGIEQEIGDKTAAPKSVLDKALTYLREQLPYLTNYLKDGRPEISNNRAERSFKPFVIDRKNFLFANTPKGATGSAIMFSLIQTAIENVLDPYRYLTWLLRTAKDANLTDTQAVQNLLPWNIPAEYRVK